MLGKLLGKTLFRKNIIKKMCLGKVKQNNASYFKNRVYSKKENVQDSYKLKNQKTNILDLLDVMKMI